MGPFRKGKSMLLNIFLRYLSHACSVEDTSDWLETDEELRGFEYASGADRVTSGIVVWLEAFEMKLPDGEDVVVLLLDTQGIFDPNATGHESATTFALALLMSSLTV